MVMRTHRGGGSCWAEAAIMFANATDIIGHGPPGTWPKQLTTTSAPVTTVVTSFEDSASPTTTVSSLESLSESLAGLRTSATTSWPDSRAIRVKTNPVAPVAPSTAIFIVREEALGNESVLSSWRFHSEKPRRCRRIPHAAARADVAGCNTPCKAKRGAVCRRQS